MVDIAQKDQLVSYLADRAVFPDAAAARVQYFSGGVSGTVALVSDGERTVIVKQALAKLKVKADWFSDPSRMRIEHEALEVYASVVPGCVPKPLSYDAVEYIQIREAAPEQCPMWKTQLLSGLLDFEVAAAVIGSLRSVHDSTAKDPAVKARFADKSFFANLRISPYIERVVERYPALAPKAAPIIESLMSTSIALVHGDYSPKNILVDGRNIFILDFEVAHFGHPSFDLAFFANHFLLKAVKNKAWSDSYLNMLAWMMESYFSAIECMEPRALERDTVRLLAFLFLARVDGKSPAEYITEESDKVLIRNVAMKAIDADTASFAEMIALTKDAVRNAAQGERK